MAGRIFVVVTSHAVCEVIGRKPASTTLSRISNRFAPVSNFGRSVEGLLPLSFEHSLVILFAQHLLAWRLVVTDFDGENISKPGLPRVARLQWARDAHSTPDNFLDSIAHFCCWPQAGYLKLRINVPDL